MVKFFGLYEKTINEISQPAGRPAKCARQWDSTIACEYERAGNPPFTAEAQEGQSRVPTF